MTVCLLILQGRKNTGTKMTLSVSSRSQLERTIPEIQTGSKSGKNGQGWPTTSPKERRGRIY